MNLINATNADLLEELTRRLQILAKADEDTLDMLSTLAAEMGCGDTYDIHVVPVLLVAEFLQAADLVRAKFPFDEE